MHRKHRDDDYVCGVRTSKTLRLVVACTIAALYSGARAVDIPSPYEDLKLRWDTSLKYSAVVRLQEADPALIGPAQANLDDGDRNFHNPGLVSNRVDIFTEADAIYKERYGVRVSAAGWYDSVYNEDNDNDSPFTANSASVPHDHFTRATRDLMGRNVELLDAFVFGGANIGEMEGTVRLGRHAQVWGETLFFGANGIAGGMVPVDFIKLLTVPGSQFKEVMMPVNQLSAHLQVRPELSLGAYYQFEWEPNRIPAAGAFSSLSDIFGEGRERLLWPTGSFFASGHDVEPRNSGQYGFQIRLRPKGWDSEFGFYALRYHQKDPNVYIRPAAGLAFFGNQGAPGERVGDFELAYHEGIRAYGVSMSTTVASANVGIEASVRDNAALVNPGAFVFDPATNNRSNSAYPVGRTVHVNASMVQLLSPTRFWEGGVFLAEIGWNRLLSISRNPQALDPNVTDTALGFRMILSPTYFQVLPGLDLSVPIGLGYNPKARSSAVSLFNGGVDEGGDFSIGLSGNYLKRLNVGLTYTTYFGSIGAVLEPSNDRLSFKQYYKDRSNLAATVQITF